MREKKFTEGPWIVYSHEADECCIEQDNDDPLQVCGLRPMESCASENYISAEQRSANADLISAAPELLEAIEDVWREIIDPMDLELDHTLKPELDKLKAAIAKAYGEQL